MAPLHLALAMGAKDMVQLLLDAGAKADIMVRNDQGQVCVCAIVVLLLVLWVVLLLLLVLVVAAVRVCVSVCLRPLFPLSLTNESVL